MTLIMWGRGLPRNWRKKANTRMRHVASLHHPNKTNCFLMSFMFFKSRIADYIVLYKIFFSRSAK